MLAKRNFNVELITLNANKTGAKTNTRSVEYKGESIAIKF
jgi:alpha-D-xyloside xylohydrolase